MLNVYGVTYDHTINYGSCFQAYALQEAITGMKLSSGEMCSYQLIPVETFREARRKHSVLGVLWSPLMALYRTRFATFEKKYMRFAEVQGSDEALPSLNEKADVFVCGSDVIWNPSLNHNNRMVFYLTFATKYKFSYAASFGKAEIDEKTISLIRETLSKLDEISVREKTGAELIKRSFDITAQVVVDPVLLLTRSEWETILPKAKKRKGYIFVYITYLSDKVKETVAKLKKATGLKVVCAAWGPKQAMSQGVFLCQTPQKWLQLLHDAEYVVTNSFHATVFAVLFRKKLFTVTKHEKNKGASIRMNDFLTAVGLEDRIFSVVPEQLDLSEIDYEEVSPKIETMREQSLEFLRENLEKAYLQKKNSEPGRSPL